MSSEMKNWRFVLLSGSILQSLCVSVNILKRRKMEDSARRTSMVFTIDQKDLYGQWNYELSWNDIKDSDLASADEQPRRRKKACFMKLVYIVLAAGTAVVTYLLYKKYLYPAADFDEK